MPPSADDSTAAALRRLEAASLDDRRRRFRQSTMSERLELAIRLSALASEIRAGIGASRR